MLISKSLNNAAVIRPELPSHTTGALVLNAAALSTDHFDSDSVPATSLRCAPVIADERSTMTDHLNAKQSAFCPRLNVATHNGP